MVNERRASPDQHPPVHGGQFLRLVDDDMPVSPFTVRRRMLGDEAVALPLMLSSSIWEVTIPSRCPLGRACPWRIALFGTFGVFGGLTGSLLGIGAEQFQGFVKQGDVDRVSGDPLGRSAR